MFVSRYLIKCVIRWRHPRPLKPQIGLHCFHFSNTLLRVRFVLIRIYYPLVQFFDSIPLDVQTFLISSFCAISSLTFRITTIFTPFDIPMMWSLNLKNFFPWSSFAMKSATILLVWQYYKPMFLLSIRSWMKKYLISMCFVRIELDARPFFSSIIALMLYW